ncbi:MAG TPA: gamma-glutamylcyclotransferase [Aliidongia sp.]|nr:gamma-glutamylcyclotransferase [Aliidongia sp.]
MDVSDKPQAPLELTRENILSGMIRRAVAGLGDVVMLSDEELAASLDHVLATHPAGAGDGDIWVFGYGSLIWNPAFTHVETQRGRIHGWHRRFCLWTPTSRGTPEKPGLTLGLDRGGSCQGVAFRTEAMDARHELAIIWRREMMSGAYRPRWVAAHLEDGRKVPAIAFTINHAHPRYTGPLDDEKAAEVIAGACGWLGPCSDYVFKTAEALAALGIRDRAFETLKERVRLLQAATA